MEEGNRGEEGEKYLRELEREGESKLMKRWLVGIDC